MSQTNYVWAPIESNFYESSGDKPIFQQFFSSVLILPTITLCFWFIVLITLFCLLMYNFRKNKKNRNITQASLGMSLYGEMALMMPLQSYVPGDDDELLDFQNLQSDVTVDLDWNNQRRPSIASKQQEELDQMLLAAVPTARSPGKLDVPSVRVSHLSTPKKDKVDIWDATSPNIISSNSPEKDTSENPSLPKVSAKLATSNESLI